MILDRSLADILVDEGYVSRERVAQLLATRRDATESIGDILQKQGAITEKQRLKCLSLQTGLPFIDLAQTNLDIDLIRMLPQKVASRLLAVPIEITEFSASVAMVNASDLAAVDELSGVLGVSVDSMWATEAEVRETLIQAFGAADELDDLMTDAMRESHELISVEDDEEDERVNVIELHDAAKDGPIVKLANALIARAVRMRASDVHIEPLQRMARVRFRVDGMLHDVASFPRETYRPLASRIKVLAGLDIAERRMPQDGRCTIASPEGEFDFRVATYPSIFGEKITIRILDKKSISVNVSQLGISYEAMRKLVECVEQPQGLILITGPTGSGKTTTLYALLNHLNAEHRHIITIEDPVEYRLDGVMQANVNPAAGLSFASGLRSILRHDPDVIMVGESRDPETAKTSIEASLTGHLVLTSLHANDSSSAVTRLIEMGIESFLVGSSVSVSVAQRLVRLTCPGCAAPYEPDQRLLERLGATDGDFKKGVGCDRCTGTGCRGRIGVYEVLVVNADIRRMVLAQAPAPEIQSYAVQHGMMSMRGDARHKVVMGFITVEEALRVTPDEESV